MTSRLGSPAAVACALLWGVQFALLAPVVAILLVELYAATPTQVGFLLAASNALGFVVVLVLPRYADRTGNYRTPLLASGVAGILLALTFALAPSLAVAGVGMVAWTGLAGVGMPLYWGYLRSSGTDPGTIIRLRSLFSVAWVAGPPAATLILAVWGARSVPWFVAAVAAGSLTASLMLVRENQPPQQPREPGDPRAPRRLLSVALICFTLLQATNTASVATMTLLVTRHLGLDVLWAGVALGLAAGLEVPAFWLVGRLIARVSPPALVALGCAAGALYHAGLVLAPGVPALLALQVLNAFFVAVLNGVGLTWFQQMVPGAAFAAGLFANTNRVGAIVAGGLVALASTSPQGYAAVFWASAAVSALVMVVISVAGRLERAGPAGLRSG